MFVASILTTGIASVVLSTPASAQLLDPGSSDGSIPGATATTCALRVGYSWNDTTKKCTPVASVGSSYNLVKRVQSYAYLNAIRWCTSKIPFALIDGQGNGISEPNAIAGKWFQAGASVPASYLASNVNPLSGAVPCNDVVSVASILWGYPSSFDMLCDFVDTRADGSPCKGGTGSFERFVKGVDDAGDADAFYNAIKTRIYSGQTPSLYETFSDGSKGYPGRYLLYKQAFINGCEARADGVSGSSGAIYNNVPIVADDGAYTTDSFSGVGTDQQRPVYVDRDNLAVQTVYCQTMVDRMNEYYLDYSIYRREHPSEEATMPAAGIKKVNCGFDALNPMATLDCITGAGTVSCGLEGVIGWLLCPAFSWLSSMSDAVFSLLADTLLKVDPKLLSQTNPADPTKPGAVYATWSVMRNLANISFVIVFLIIIFSQMTSAGISNYGVKKMLPRLVIAALLVNLSFFICQIGVDLSNILGYSLKDVLESTGQTIKTTATAVDPDTKSIDFASMLIGVFAIGTLAGGGSIMLMNAALILFLVVMIAALIAIIMTVLMLIGRLPLIIILTVLSPLAFVAFMLPNTKNVFNQWAKLYFALLMMFPLVSLVFGLGSLTAAIITTSFSISNIAAVDQVIVPIIGMAIQLLPLFFVPFALKKLMGGMGAIGGAMAALGNKAQSAGKAVSGAAKAGTRALAKRGFNEGLGRMANSKFGSSKGGRRLGGLISGRGQRGFSAMGAAHESETNKNIIEGWKRDKAGTYHNSSALESIARDRPHSAEGRAAMAALAEKGDANELSNLRAHHANNSFALSSLDRAVAPHYSGLKSKNPGAVMAHNQIGWGNMKATETYDLKDQAMFQGISSSAAFADTIRQAATDPVLYAKYTPAVRQWAQSGVIPPQNATIPGGGTPAAGPPPAGSPAGLPPPTGSPRPGPAPAPAPAPTAGGGRRASAPQGPPPTGGGAPVATPTPPASTWTQVIQGAAQTPAGTPPTTTTTTTNANGGRRVTTSGPVDASSSTPPAPETTDLSISHDDAPAVPAAAPRPSRRASQPGDLEARQAADPGNQTGFYVDGQGRQTPNSIAPEDADDYHSQFGG
ncbi:MAG: hypothetical protein WAO28_02865 [Candidatus Microsaccharimonas sp.]